MVFVVVFLGFNIYQQHVSVICHSIKYNLNNLRFSTELVRTNENKAEVANQCRFDPDSSPRVANSNRQLKLRASITQFLCLLTSYSEKKNKSLKLRSELAANNATFPSLFLTTARAVMGLADRMGPAGGIYEL